MVRCHGSPVRARGTNLLVDHLVSGRGKLGGIRDFFGEPGDAAQEMVVRIFALAACSGDVAQVGNLLVKD